MTQVLAYQCEKGIVLSSDSRAVVYSAESDNCHFITVTKLFHLGPHTVAVSAGAGYGIWLCERLQGHLLEMDCDDYVGIVAEALLFLHAQLIKLREDRSIGNIRAELDRFYILIAGHLPGEEKDPFQFVLLGAEGPSDPLHVIPTGHVVAVPRHLGSEYRLARLIRPVSALDEVESIVEDLLVKMAQKDDGIGPPFHFIRISPGGITTRTRWS